MRFSCRKLRKKTALVSTSIDAFTHSISPDQRAASKHNLLSHKKHKTSLDCNFDKRSQVRTGEQFAAPKKNRLCPWRITTRKRRVLPRTNKNKFRLCELDPSFLNSAKSSSRAVSNASVRLSALVLFILIAATRAYTPWRRSSDGFLRADNNLVTYAGCHPDLGLHGRCLRAVGKYENRSGDLA